LSLGGILTYAQKERANKNTGRVEFSVKVHPTVNLSPEDEKALNDVLAKFDKSLYRIVVLKDGEIEKDRSTGDLQLSREMTAELADAQKKHLTGLAPEFIPVGGMIAASPLFNKQKADDAAKLLDAIAPILRKYQLPAEGPSAKDN
jgi:hypothetical protein